MLQFRLETQLLHIQGGNLSWLEFTSADLGSVLENLRFETLARNVEAAALAADWHVPGEPTLPVLCAAAPDGVWGELLRSHGHEMAALLARIRSAVRANLDSLEEALGAIERELAGAGALSEPADELVLLARQSSAVRAKAAVEECGQPLLAEFLGQP